MQVFNTFLKVARNKIPSIISYVITFFAVSIAIVSINTSDKAVYEAARLDIVVFDNDNTAESRAFVDYLSKTNNVVEKEMTDQQIKSELFYRASDYILTINEGYAAKLANGETEGLFTSQMLPSTYSSVFADAQINQYVSLINMYCAGGFTPDEAIKKAGEEQAQTEITVEAFDEQGGSYDIFAYNYYRLLPYLFLTVIITGVSGIIVSMRRRILRERVMCAPVSGVNFTGQIILGTIVVSFAVWLFMIIASVFLIGTDVIFTTQSALVILNSFIFMLVSVAVAILICTFISGSDSSAKAQRVIVMLSNIVSLGMSFLCGIFVPQSLLGEGVANIGRFLPAYWYVQALENIAQTNGQVFDLQTVLGSMGIEMLFAAAMLAVALVISKAKKTA